MLEIGIRVNNENSVVVYSDYELEQFRKYIENSDNYIKLSWYDIKPDRETRNYRKTEPKTGYFRKETIQFFGEVEKGRFQI